MNSRHNETTELFAWSSRFVTGIEALDDEHRVLVERVNRLAQGALGGADSETLLRWLSDIQDEAARHFHEEEQLMQRYPLAPAEVASHAAAHASLLDQLRSVRSLANVSSAPVAVARLLPFFAKWLLFHMLGSDVRMAHELAALRSGETPERAAELAKAQQPDELAGVLDALNEIMDNLALRTVELQEANQRLRVSEARLAAAQRAAGISAWDLDPHTLALTGSGEVEWLVANAQGQEPFSLLMTRVQAEDRAALWTAIEAIRAGARDCSVRFRVTGSSGRLHWFEVVGECLGEPGAEHVVGVLREITAEKQAQTRLEESNAQLVLSLGALERYAADLTRLNELSAGLQGCGNATEAFALVERVLVRMELGSGGALAVCEGAELKVVARWGDGAHLSPLLPHADCPALMQGLRHVHGPGTELPACRHGVTPPQPYLCQPLRAMGEVLGVLCVAAPRAVAEADWARIVHLSTMVGEALGLALSNVRLREALHEQAIRDPLTGLLNRRYLSETLPRELLRAAREQRSLVLAMVDLDHFKRINDTWGHEAGDAVLARFALLLRHHLRASDLACRFGGEEFVVVLAGATLEEARERFAELAARVREHPARVGSTELPVVTFSAGLVQAMPGAEAEALLRAADQALYQAKADGRNCLREALLLAQPAFAPEIQEGNDHRGGHQRQ